MKKVPVCAAAGAAPLIKISAAATTIFMMRECTPLPSSGPLDRK
jgi:hypothetical protein